MKLVIIESPYASNDLQAFDTNCFYAEEAMRDSINRGESPLVGHLHYTVILDDDDPAQRAQGIECALAWMAKADLVAVYQDRGISPGMRVGIAHADWLKKPIEYRSLGGW